MKVRSRYLLVLAMAWSPCLLAAAASYAVILGPQQDCMKELEAKVTSGREKYAQALQATKETNQSRLTQEVGDLHQRVGGFVVSVEEAPNLAFTLGTLANEAQLESLGMRPAHKIGGEAALRGECVGAKHVDLSFVAGFRSFAAFLNALERHRPIILVETFAISRPAEENAQPQASMELAVLVEKTPGRAEEPQ